MAMERVGLVRMKAWVRLNSWLSSSSCEKCADGGQVVEKMENGGRQVTRVGQQDLDRIAGAVVRGED